MKLRIDVEDVVNLIDNDVRWCLQHPQFSRDRYYLGMANGLVMARAIISNMSNITDEEVETILDKNSV